MLVESIVITAFLLGIISACSLPLGTLTTLFWKPSDRSIAFLMAFGGGALLAALTLDLVAGTVAHGDFYPLAAGCIAGGMIFIGLNGIVNDLGGFLRKASTTFYHLRKQEYRKFRRILSVAKRVDVFRDLNDKGFKELADSIHNRDVKKGALVFSQGDPCDELYIIASGSVDLFDAKEKIETVHLGKNNDLGWLAFLTGTPYRFTARATDDVNLWVLPKSSFFGLLPNSPILVQAVQRWLRGAKVTNYLQIKHGMDAETVRQWSDQAVHSLLRRSLFSVAIQIEHKGDSFRAMASQIRGIEWFGNLPHEELQAIIDRLIFKQFTRGETFFYAGEEAVHMFIIEHGAVSILDPVNRLSHAIDLSPRDAFGHMAFFTGSRYSMSALATEETGVWVLRQIDFVRLLVVLPEFARRFAEFLQQAHVKTYLEEKQMLSHDNASIWINKAVKNIAASKEIIPVTKINFDIGTHKGAPLGIWLGIMLDGIPEALVIGASVRHSGLALSLLAGLFFSNYPEALSSSMGMREQGMKFKTILAMWTSLMLITGILSALGSIYFAGVSDSVFAFTEGVAAGAMLTMIAQTMLPEAYFKGGDIIGFSTLLGFLCAIFFKTLE